MAIYRVKTRIGVDKVKFKGWFNFFLDGWVGVVGWMVGLKYFCVSPWHFENWNWVGIGFGGIGDSGVGD